MHVTEKDWEKLNPAEVVSVAETSVTSVVMYRIPSKEDTPFIVELKSSPGVLHRFWATDGKQARLLVGIFNQCMEEDPSLLLSSLSISSNQLFQQDGFVPLSIALAGKPYIAAYLKCVADFDVSEGDTRERVANRMSTSKQTVSTYWNRARWEGCTVCGTEDVDEFIVEVPNGDKVTTLVCKRRGHVTVVPEDLDGHRHTPSEGSSRSNCVEQLERVTARSEPIGEILFGHCPVCGFYTADTDKIPKR